MWSAIGALVGLLIGMVDDQLVPGLAIGLALGMALDAQLRSQQLAQQLKSLQQHVAQLRALVQQHNGALPAPSQQAADAMAAAAAIVVVATETLSSQDARAVMNETAPSVACDSETSPKSPWSVSDSQGVLSTAVPSGGGPSNAAKTPAAEQDPWQSSLPLKPAPASTNPAAAAARSPDKSVSRWLQTLLAKVNPVVLAGLAVLFIGLSFLATYFAHQGLLSMEVRLGLIGAVGLGLIGLGWVKRDKLGQHAPLLQGGGIAIVYLMLFAACKYYPMIDSGTAFGLMLVTVLAGVGLAWLQQSQPLAILATVGGFLVPILTSDGSNNFVGLFTYYLLLNGGVLLLAHLQLWRPLNWTGFVLTFGISTGWQLWSYQPSDYALVQPFFAAYFAMYLLIGYWFTFRQGNQLRGFVDGSLVFGLPLVSFAQQLLLTEQFAQGDTFSTIAYAAIYAGMYGVVRRQQRDDLQRFGQIQLGFAVMFASLIVPFWQGGQWTSFGWALEAAGLCWLGFLQQSRVSRVGAYLLMLGALVSFALNLPTHTGDWWFIQGDFINLLVLALSLLVMAVCADRMPDSTTRLGIEPFMQRLALVGGWLCWHWAFFAELQAHLSVALAWQVVVAVLSTSLMLWLAARWQLRSLRLWGYSLLPFAACLYLQEVEQQGALGVWLPVLTWSGMLAVLLLVTVHYRWLRTVDTPHVLYRLGMPWLLGGLVLWQARYWGGAWQLTDNQWLALLFVVIALPHQLVLWLTTRDRWPHMAPPLSWLSLPWQLGLLGIWGWSVVARADGIAILNWPDVVMLLSLVCWWHYLVAVPTDHPSRQRLRLLLALFGFITGTVLLVRTLQLSLGLPWLFEPLWQASEIQLALSIGWALLALVLMWRGHQLQHRLRWQCGAALLAVVLVKLFLVDLADAGSLSRIISFITVGGLTLLIGIKAPMPKALPTQEVATGLAADDV